jgi:hypothetical protein
MLLEEKDHYDSDATQRQDTVAFEINSTSVGIGHYRIGSFYTKFTSLYGDQKKKKD